MDEKELAAIGRRRARLRAQLAEATGAAKEAVREAAAAGVTEMRLKELMQVDRMTIRDWLGKKR